MKRSSVDKNDFRANISQGGKGEKVELSKEDQDLCIKAAHSIGLNVAGVDLMKNSETGQSYIIEINSNPGVKIIDITGHNPFEDILDFCEANYKKGTTGGVTAIQGNYLPDLLTSGDFMCGLVELLKSDRISKEMFKIFFEAYENKV